MTRKRKYISPCIDIVLLDIAISIVMATENSPTDPGDKPEANLAPNNTYDTKEDNSGIKENPFAR